MSTVVIFPTDSIKAKDGSFYSGVKEMIEKLKEDGNEIVFISHQQSKLDVLKEEFPFGKCYLRKDRENKNDIRTRIKKGKNEHFILVGSHNADLYLASNTKILLINPRWSDVQEEKAVRYGVPILSPLDLYKAIKIANNQRAWYYTLEIDDKTKLYSLTRANSHQYYGLSEEELKMVEGFNRLLKAGDKSYFKTLLHHFLASIMNNPEFKNVDYWSIMPSSGTELNEDMLAFKERVRYLMGKKTTEPIFIRHTATVKSRLLPRQLRLYCNRHFDTIHINPYYRKKLKNKTVCLLDDYLTNGTSFEALRNLLLKAQVKKIIFVSLGRFKKSAPPDYYKQDYEIDGDIYTPFGYSYNLLQETELIGEYDEQAINDIEQLHEIIFHTSFQT